MKKIITLAILLVAFAANNTFAQQACTWAKKAGGTQEDWGTDVATDNAGNVYYLGNFYSQSIVIGSSTLANQPYIAFNYGAEMFLAKYDACGNFVWARSAGGSDETMGKGLTCDANGNIFVTGYTQADTLHFNGSSVYLTNNNNADAFIAKYNSSGVVQWAVQGTGDYLDRGYSVTVDAANNVYVAGGFSSTMLTFGSTSVPNQYNAGDFEVFIGKFDNTTGACQWLRKGSGDYDDYAFGISATPTGDVYVTGTFGSSDIRFGNDSISLAPSGYYDIYIVKYDANGNELWLRTAGDVGNDESYDVAVDASGNAYITGFIGYNETVTFGNGQTIVNTKPSYNFFLTKYDAAGTALWARTAQCDAYTENRGYRLDLDGLGNPYVIGLYSSDSLNLGAITLQNASMTSGAMSGGDTAYDVFVAKYKSNGNLQWARTLGGDNHDFGYGIANGPNYSLYVCGEFLSNTMVVNGISLTGTNNLGNAFIANNVNISNETPNICLVTSDSLSTNNIVFWDKTPFADVDSFIIYREVSTGTYKRIGAQPYSALSQFIDTSRSVGPANGDPNVGTYRYKIQTLDTAGNLGKMSPYHNTVYFIDNGGGTFTWNAYNVENTTTPVINFNLMRDNLHNGNYIQVGSVSGTQTTLNDPAYATYSLTADWRVEATGFSCIPTAKYGNNSTLGAIIKSKSNITNNRGIGVQQIDALTQLLVYPNPVTTVFVITASKELGLVTVTNSLGEVVYQVKTNASEAKIDISKFPTGIYIVNALGGHSKLIKE